MHADTHPAGGKSAAIAPAAHELHVFGDARANPAQGELTEYGHESTVRHLMRARSELVSLLDLAADWRWETDPDLRILKVSGSRSFMKVGSLLDENVHPEETKKWQIQKQRMSAYVCFRDFEFRALDHRGTGHYRWVTCSGEPYFDDSGKFLGYRGIGRDITDKVTEKEGLWSLANLDTLTGLPNRMKFSTELEFAIRSQNQQPFALAIIDLDNFKTINDTFGHDCGDQLLISMSERIRSVLRSTDVIARLGGDEFALIIRGVEQDESLYRPLDAILEAMRPPIDIGGQSKGCTLSIGVALFPEHAQTAADLLKSADIALYYAKGAGKSRYSVFHSEQKVEVDRKNKLTGEIENALEDGALLLHYQPIVDVQRGRVSGIETLLRWNKPGAGIISAGDFQEVFDNSVLAAKIGRFVTEESIRQAAAWLAQGHDIGRIAINVTRADFTIGDFPLHLSKCASDHGVPPAKIAIEVTEGMFLGSTADVVLEGIHALHAMGFEIAFDDYGTGYASLTHLKMRIDRLKIDRSFVKEVEFDNVDRAIITAIADLSKSLGKCLTVEGVETASQASLLARMGCTNMQGYFFSKPIPGDQIPSFLNFDIRSMLEEQCHEQ